VGTPRARGTFAPYTKRILSKLRIVDINKGFADSKERRRANHPGGGRAPLLYGTDTRWKAAPDAH
jgi:hypothetical protein